MNHDTDNDNIDVAWRKNDGHNLVNGGGLLGVLSEGNNGCGDSSADGIGRDNNGYGT